MKRVLLQHFVYRSVTYTVLWQQVLMTCRGLPLQATERLLWRLRVHLACLIGAAYYHDPVSAASRGLQRTECFDSPVELA